MSGARSRLALAKILPLEGRLHLGTAFATRDNVAVTAFHCLSRDDNPGEVVVPHPTLEFNPGGKRVAASFEEGDPAEDWAVLKLGESIPGEFRPIALCTEVQDGEVCRCLGFPQDAEEISRFPEKVTVLDTEAEIEGARVLTLHGEAAAAGMALHGMSGSPVLLKGAQEEAVGLLRRHLPRIDDPEMPAGGKLFACPTALFSGAAILNAELPEEGEQGHIERLRSAAGLGDSGAAARLGHLLRARGEAEAEAWLEQAARAGDAAAAFALGRMLEQSQRGAEGRVWIRRAAMSGDIAAAATLGVRLRQEGRNDAAIDWLERATESGDAMAAHTLALIREEYGDLTEAERLQRYAAERGDPRAALSLARMLRERDRDEAIYWLRRAATVDPDAVRELEALGVGLA
jgi:hypothetical protein